MPDQDELRCRDCGNIIAAGERGCSRCALNLEAERMFDRAVLLAAAAILLALVTVVYIFYLRR